MNNIALLNEKSFLTEDYSEFQQLKTHYDEKYKAGWFLMNGAPRPCVTPTLLNNISSYFDNIKKEMSETNNEKYEYLILGSDIEGVFCLGGDLNLFTHYIETNNRTALLSYAIQCIDILFQNITHYNLNMTSISLVQGDALGGGFEAALSCNVIIAEKGVKMGLPEVLFNMFPGMGAFSLLSRKIGPVKAEQLILSGEIYSAEEMFEMGVIDILAEKGDGEMAVYQYIKNANRTRNTHQAMRKVKDVYNNIPYEELLDITRIWVDSVFKLSKKDIRIMQRLINRQNSKVKVSAN